MPSRKFCRCDAGNVDFDDMYGTPLVMELCDKFKAESSAITGSSGRSSHPLSQGLDLVRLMRNSDDYDALSPVGEKEKEYKVGEEERKRRGRRETIKKNEKGRGKRKRRRRERRKWRLCPALE